MLVKILTLVIALYKVIATDNSYAIIGSKYIQPGANFKVFVVSDSIHEDPYDLHIELTGEGYSDVKNVAFDSDSELHKEVEFRQIPANSNGTFHLRTWQNGDKDAKSVDLKTDKVVVIIQTDKVVYRTNDVIEYKVIPLNSNYQPITVAKMTVMVSDADGNVVQADLVKKESNYQNILKLSESPVTGMWKIEVMIDKVKHKKEIEVKDSTLVPFYVSIDTKKHLTIEYDNIVADIWAKDENGEYVSGSVKVKAKVYDSEYPELMKFEVSKDFKIIDKKTVSFDMKREMRIFNILGKNLVELEVIFQKTFPYVSQTGSSKIRLHRRDEYQIDFSKVQKQFKPDLNYRFFAFVTKSDGSLLMDKSNPIKVTTTFYTKSVEFCDKDVEEKVKILEDDFFMINGYADVQIKVPKDAVKMKILSKYQDASKTINVSRSYGVSDKFISLSMVTKRPNLAKYVVFKIESSEEIDHIYYVFLGPNGPFLSDVRKFDSNNNVHELQFNRTQILSPKCQLVVYYFHASGDFIYDKIPVEISLPNKSTNYLNLAYGSETNEINFNTDKNAFVGILEMDAATLNRTFDKDFATKIIMEHFGLKGFEGKDGNLYPTFEPDKSNSFLITNTNVSRKACITSYSRGEDVIPSDTFNKGGFLIAEQIDEPNAINDEIVSSQQPKDSVLQQSQAYNIQSINADNDGSGNVKIKNKNIPIAVAGFSLHPTKGLIISEPTLIDNKENNLKLEIHPPHTVIRDEIFGIPCVLTNIGSKIVIGTLTLHKNNDELSDIYKVKSKCHESNNQQSKRATILPSNTTQSYFLVSALRTGLVNISVQFTPNDEIQQITSSAFVSVKHAPNINKLSKSAFVDIHESTKELNLTEFKNDDNKPMEVEVNAYADIMLLSLDNLDDLVDQPFGLGEQAIFKLATSLIAYEYLEKKKTLNDDTKKKLSDRILAGYLDILSFKHVDGSFKVKKSDNYGNVWLTAFVLKNLIHANQKSLIYLEKSAIEKTIKFIGKNNIADNAIAALLFEASSYSNDYKIELENLAKKFKSNQNTDRNIALQSYVSQLELTPHLNNLQSLTFNDQSTQLKTQEQIETASYAIMVLVEAGRIDDAIEIAKWLIKHQNYNGGFYTIRDTVIGLQALAKLSLAIADKYKTFKITIEGMTLHINSNNEIQKGKFNMQQNIVQVSLEENGFGVIHIRAKKSFEANVLTENKKVTFGTQQRQPASNVKIYDFTVCPTYNETNRDEIIKKYGADIIVLEVVLPSGYFFDTDTLASYKEFSYIEKVEVTEKKKIVKFFLNDVPDKITCIQVKTFLLNSVGFPRRSFVRMYQYYNLNDVAIKFKDTETGFCS